VRHVGVRTLGVIGGYLQRGDLLFPKLKLALPDHNLVVVDLPEKGFNIHAICSGFKQAFENLKRHHKIDMQCNSLGGIPLRHVMEQCEDLEFGHISLDAAAFTWSDVRLKRRFMAYSAKPFRKINPANRVYQLLTPDGFGVRGNYSIGRGASYVDWVKNYTHPDKVPENYDRVTYSCSRGVDNTVDTTTAIPKYGAVFSKSLNVIRDDLRPFNAHTCNPVTLAQAIHGLKSSTNH